jgi:hypothetical protein
MREQMEIVIDHQIEPVVAAPPPRAAQLPASTNILLLAATLLFGLFIYGGSRALVEAWKLAWLGVMGHPIAAQVTQVLTATSQVKGAPDQQIGLRYSYTLPFGPDRTLQTGVAHLMTPDVNDTTRPQEPLPRSGQKTVLPNIPVFHIGDRLPLRGAEWLGRPLVYPWQAAPTGKVVFLLLCGGLVIGISVLLLRRIVRWRGHRLRLLRYGVATTGTIVHKEARAEDAPRYYLRYGYAVETEPREHEEQVSIEQWKRLDIGQPVTVLYDPECPDDAGLYLLIGR